MGPTRITPPTFMQAHERIETNLMAVDLYDPHSIYNTPSVVRTNDASELVNSPITSGLFYAARYVVWIGECHVLVIMFEMYPVAGRIWENWYNVGWQGWKSVTPA